MFGVISQRNYASLAFSSCPLHHHHDCWMVNRIREFDADDVNDDAQYMATLASTSSQLLELNGINLLFVSAAFKTDCTKNNCTFQCTDKTIAVLNTAFTKAESTPSNINHFTF